MASTLAMALIISVSFGSSDASRMDAEQVSTLVKQLSGYNEILIQQVISLKQQLEENQRQVLTLREESSTVQSVGPPLPEKGGGNDKKFYCCHTADGQDWGWLQLKPGTDIGVKTAEQAALAKVAQIRGVNVPTSREAGAGEFALPSLEGGVVADGRRGWWVQAINIAVEFKPKSMAQFLDCKKVTSRRKVRGGGGGIIKTAAQKRNALQDLQSLKAGLRRLVKIVGEITVLVKDDGHMLLIDAAPDRGTPGGDELLDKAGKGLEKCIQELGRRRVSA